MDLRSVFRPAFVFALVGALGAVLLGAGGHAPSQRIGRTAQGQEIRVKVQHGTATAIATNALVRCTDGDRWNVGWTVPDRAIRHAGRHFTVLHTASNITLRIDGEVAGGHATGVLRAIGKRGAVRCDSGAVKFSA